MAPSVDNVVEDAEMTSQETNGQANGQAHGEENGEAMAVDRPSTDVKMRVTLKGVNNDNPYLYRNQVPQNGIFIIYLLVFLWFSW